MGNFKKKSWYIFIFKDYFSDTGKDACTFLKVPFFSGQKYTIDTKI